MCGVVERWCGMSGPGWCVEVWTSVERSFSDWSDEQSFHGGFPGTCSGSSAISTDIAGAGFTIRRGLATAVEAAE